MTTLRVVPYRSALTVGLFASLVLLMFVATVARRHMQKALLVAMRARLQVSRGRPFMEKKSAEWPRSLTCSQLRIHAVAVTAHVALAP